MCNLYASGSYSCLLSSPSTYNPLAAEIIPRGLSSHFSSSSYELPNNVPVFVALTSFLLFRGETHQQVPVTKFF
ncbi:hypothetical protein MJO28_001979 [Puccinia striiformis f. sp. tritici]|uniref:Uncharacterized protein n=1 Tax=Puccinia striiformis f. sp. tritici TaxID=168172 RepID=A0ACC0EVK2_9BASI|nr:hypothetical protein MJO28_001979 [Puccinia striiformis f. sp. tritici]